MLERQLPIDNWLAPIDVGLDEKGDSLVWRPQAGYRRVEGNRGVLSEFVALATAPPERILEYARRWGVLEICEHGVPRTHRSPGAWPYSIAFPFCKPQGDESAYQEPLGAWRSLSAEVAMILNAAAGLYAGRPAKCADLAAPFAAVFEAPEYGDDDWADATHVSFGVNNLLALADVRPVLAWEEGHGWGVVLGRTSSGRRIDFVPGAYWSTYPGGPFATIATNLAFSVARSDGLAICSACGQAFTPGRKPRAGERTYCRSCRASGAAVRDASRDYYGRKRRGRQAS